jgi:hypothetical protein
MEYHPKPPFHAGAPKEAGPEMVKKVRDRLGPLDGVMWQAFEQAGGVVMAGEACEVAPTSGKRGCRGAKAFSAA